MNSRKFRPGQTKEFRDRVRDKILDVAARLFAEQGFAGTSLEEVIKQCGIGKDTLYRRFSSKLALFEAMVRREREIFDAKFEAVIRESPGSELEQLKAIARWLLDTNLTPRLIAFKRIAFSEARVVGRSVQEAGSPAMDQFADLIARLQVQGVLQPGAPPELAGYILNALILGPMMAAMLGDERQIAEDWRRDYFDRTWPLILGGLQKDGKRQAS